MVKVITSPKAFFIGLVGTLVSLGVATAWVLLFRPEVLGSGDFNAQEIYPFFIPAGVFAVLTALILLVALFNALYQPLISFGSALLRFLGQVITLSGLLLINLIVKPLVFVISLLGKAWQVGWSAARLLLFRPFAFIVRGVINLLGKGVGAGWQLLKWMGLGMAVVAGVLLIQPLSLLISGLGRLLKVIGNAIGVGVYFLIEGLVIVMKALGKAIIKIVAVLWHGLTKIWALIERGLIAIGRLADSIFVALGRLARQLTARHLLLFAFLGTLISGGVGLVVSLRVYHDWPQGDPPFDKVLPFFIPAIVCAALTLLLSAYVWRDSLRRGMLALGEAVGNLLTFSGKVLVAIWRGLKNFVFKPLAFLIRAFGQMLKWLVLSGLAVGLFLSKFVWRVGKGLLYLLGQALRVIGFSVKVLVIRPLALVGRTLLYLTQKALHLIRLTLKGLYRLLQSLWVILTNFYRQITARHLLVFTFIGTLISGGAGLVVSLRVYPDWPQGDPPFDEVLPFFIPTIVFTTLTLLLSAYVWRVPLWRGMLSLGEAAGNFIRQMLAVIGFVLKNFIIGPLVLLLRLLGKALVVIGRLLKWLFLSTVLVGGLLGKFVWRVGQGLFSLISFALRAVWLGIRILVIRPLVLVGRTLLYLVQKGVQFIWLTLKGLFRLLQSLWGLLTRFYRQLTARHILLFAFLGTLISGGTGLVISLRVYPDWPQGDPPFDKVLPYFIPAIVFAALTTLLAAYVWRDSLGRGMLRLGEAAVNFIHLLWKALTVIGHSLTIFVGKPLAFLLRLFGKALMFLIGGFEQIFLWLARAAFYSLSLIVMIVGGVTLSALGLIAVIFIGLPMLVIVLLVLMLLGLLRVGGWLIKGYIALWRIVSPAFGKVLRASALLIGRVLDVLVIQPARLVRRAAIYLFERVFNLIGFLWSALKNLAEIVWRALWGAWVWLRRRTALQWSFIFFVGALIASAVSAAIAFQRYSDWLLGDPPFAIVAPIFYPAFGLAALSLFTLIYALRVTLWKSILALGVALVRLVINIAKVVGWVLNLVIVKPAILVFRLVTITWQVLGNLFKLNWRGLVFVLKNFVGRPLVSLWKSLFKPPLAWAQKMLPLPIRLLLILAGVAIVDYVTFQTFMAIATLKFNDANRTGLMVALIEIGYLLIQVIAFGVFMGSAVILYQFIVIFLRPVLPLVWNALRLVMNLWIVIGAILLIPWPGVFWAIIITSAFLLYKGDKSSAKGFKTIGLMLFVGSFFLMVLPAMITRLIGLALIAFGLARSSLLKDRAASVGRAVLMWLASASRGTFTAIRHHPRITLTLALPFILSGAFGWAYYSRALCQSSLHLNCPPQTTTAPLPCPAAIVPGVVEICFYSSNTTEDWINVVTAKFNAAQFKIAAGQTISVTVFHVTSGGSQKDIIDGKIHPTVWKPGDQSLVDDLNQIWIDRHGHPLIPGACPSTIYAPVGFAMWRPMAEAMGWPDIPIGWHEIVDLATDPQGWARYGHPEWGQFKFGHTNPLYSNSGKLMLTALAYSTLGVTDGLTFQSVKSQAVVEAMSQLELHTYHYGTQSRDFLKLMAQRGPEYLHASTSTEAETLKYSQETGKDFVFIFPAEGEYWTGQLYCILDAEWVSAGQHEAAMLYRDYLFAPEQQLLAIDYGLRPLDTSLPLHCPLCLEAGTDPRANPQTVPDLGIPSAEASNAIKDVFLQTKKKATIVVVLDTSGSMQGEMMTNAISATSNFLRSLQKDDEVYVIHFDDTVTDLGGGRAGDVAETLSQQLSELRATGKTALYDAVCAGTDRLAQVKSAHEAAGDLPRLYGLVLLSDGEDTSSHRAQSFMYFCLPHGETAGEARVYTIAYGDLADKALLADIAKRTNGRAFSGDPKTIEQVYTAISAEQ